MRPSTQIYFQFSKSLCEAPYFDTPASQKLHDDVMAAIEAGEIIAISGVVGSGKTRCAKRLRKKFQQEGNYLVAKVWSIEKEKVKFSTFMAAIFYDAFPDLKIPRKIDDKRQRLIIELVRNKEKSLVLFCDDAHGLPTKTLADLKRFHKEIRNEGINFSVVLTGKPALTKTLKRESLRKIRSRVRFLTFDFLGGYERAFLFWLITHCAEAGVESTDIFTPDAIEVLAKKAKTPLRLIYFAQESLDLALKLGKEKVDVETVTSVLESNLSRMAF